MTKLQIQSSIVKMALTGRPHTGRVSISDIASILDETSQTHPTSGYIERIEVGNYGSIILNVEYGSLALLLNCYDDQQTFQRALTETWANEESELLNLAGIA